MNRGVYRNLRGSSRDRNIGNTFQGWDVGNIGDMYVQKIKVQNIMYLSLCQTIFFLFSVL